MENFHQRSEHNHADPEAWPTEVLSERAKYLGDQVKQPWIHGERRENIQREISLIAFELWSRHQEATEELNGMLQSETSSQLDSE